MKNVKINIWDREFNLPIEFDVLDNEEFDSVGNQDSIL